MAGLFNFAGWVIFVIGVVIGVVAILIGALTFGAMTGVVIALGGLLTAAPFFAVGEVLSRLERLQALQVQANEINAAILTVLQGKPAPVEPVELPDSWGGAS